MELMDDYIQLNKTERISYGDIVRIIKSRDYGGFCHMSIYGNGKGWNFDFNAGTSWQAIDNLAKEIQTRAGDHHIIVETHDGVKSGWIGLGVGVGIILVVLLLFVVAEFTSKRSSGSNYGSNTRTAVCEVCGRSFEAGDSDGNFKNIARTHMCNNCYANYEWGQKAIGNDF